jgi:C-terminal processing protease CtpA/Prc
MGEKQRKLAMLIAAGGALVSLSLLGSAAGAKNDPAARLRHERLAALGRLWGAVRTYHPYLAYRDVDWDGALVAAVPKVTAARSDDDYLAALRSLVEPLRDPATVIASAPAVMPPEGSDGTRNRLDWPAPGLLAVHLGGFENFAAMREFEERATKALPGASTVVLDIRGRGNEDLDSSDADVAAAICRRFVTHALQAPTQRFLVHSGFVSQDPEVRSSGSYSSAFLTPLASTFAADADAKPRRLIVVVNAASPLPDVLVALLQSGDAQLVAHGLVTEAAIVTRKSIDLFGGLQAKIRVSELTFPLEGGALRADVTVPPSGPPRSDDAAFRAALELARTPSLSATVRHPAARPLPEGQFRYDEPYGSMTAPKLPYRLLAVFRYWNAIHDFYPYLPLLDHDWDSLLPDFVGQFEAAEDETAYALALGEMVAHVQDGHSSIGAPAAVVDRIVGSARAPFRVRRIDGAVVVADITDRAAAEASGVAVGDLVLSVDGEPIEQRIARLARYTPASNPAAKAFYLANRALRGPEGTIAVVAVRDIHDRVKSLKVKRSKAFVFPVSSAAHFRVLDGNIGYVDLTQLSGDEVGPMFDALGGTRALVFDMRGYPKGTAWQVAPRINARGAKFAALFQRAVVDGAEGEEQPLRLQFAQRLPPDNSGHSKYANPTVMLVDERTQSQAEHTGLFFEAASGTRFVGSQTAGANGDVTTVVVPGAVHVSFTGHDVRHADGRQLQRVGLVPDVEVHPTLAGFRSGKDEVLDCALHVLLESARDCNEPRSRR